jgi:addiction module RelE/StbE family toxin
VVRKIKWTLRALNDLQEIYSFIARDSIQYARIQVENIQSAVSKLTYFPQMGRVVPELSNLLYREILVGNYRVIYNFTEEQNQILIMFVGHGRQLLKETLR